MEGIGTFAIALSVGLVVLVLILVLSRRIIWPLIVATSSFLTIPIGLPLAPVTVLSGISSLRLTREALLALARPVPLLLILQVFAYGIALLWSSGIGIGVGSMLTTIALLLLILFAVSVGRASKNIDLLRSTVYAMAPMALVQSISTIIFRLSPQAEAGYLRSNVAIFFLGDEARLLFTTRPNNVTDPLKAGGLLFVNGNRASMVMAVLALTYLALWMRRHALHLLLLFGVCMTGAVMTGSKTAIVLTVVLPLFFLILPSVLNRRMGSGTRLLSLAVMIAGSILAAVLASRLPDYLVGADRSAEDRRDLLTAALDYFRESPVFGLGFGGWANHWALDAGKYGLGAGLPPHNFLVLEWANAGIGAALILVIIISILLISYHGLIRRAGSRSDARYFSLLMGAITWIFVHGLFDNTTFYGTAHTLPLFAVLVTLTLEPSANSSTSGWSPVATFTAARVGSTQS